MTKIRSTDINTTSVADGNVLQVVNGVAVWAAPTGDSGSGSSSGNSAGGVNIYAVKAALDGVSTYTFDVPAGYSTLRLVLSGATMANALQDNPKVIVNGRTDAVYSTQRIYGFGTGIYADEDLAATSWSSSIGGLPGATAPVDSSGFIDIEVFDYSNATLNKTGKFQSRQPFDTTTNHAGQMSGVIEASITDAITTITISTSSGSNFVNGSTVGLYLLPDAASGLGISDTIGDDESLAPHLYWRVYMDAGYGQYCYSAATIEFRATKGGPTQCVGGTPIESGSYDNTATSAAANAFDSDPSTFWSGNGASTAAVPYASWIGYQFATPVSVVEVAVGARNDGVGGSNQTGNVQRFQYSDDGSTWFTAWTINCDTVWGVGEVRVFNTPHLVATVGLSNLSDVDLTTAPTDGQALVWSASESKFLPGSVAASGSSGSAFLRGEGVPDNELGGGDGGALYIDDLNGAIYGPKLSGTGVQISARYWGFIPLVTGNGYFSLGEMLFYDVNNVQLAPSSAFMDSNSSSYPPSNAFDGNINSFTVSTSGAANGTNAIWFDFGAPVTVDHITFYNRQDSYGPAESWTSWEMFASQTAPASPYSNVTITFTKHADSWAQADHHNYTGVNPFILPPNLWGTPVSLALPPASGIATGGKKVRVPTALGVLRPLSDFTLVNMSGTMSVTEYAGKAFQMLDIAPTASTPITRGIKITAPSTKPYRVRAFIQYNTPSYNYHGICFGYMGSAGQMETAGLLGRGDGSISSVEHDTFNDPNTRLTANGIAMEAFAGVSAGGWWIGLHDDGTNVSFEISGDGATFFPLFSVVKSSGYLAGDYSYIYIGLYDLAYAFSGVTAPISMSLLDYDEKALTRTPGGDTFDLGVSEFATPSYTNRWGTGFRSAEITVAATGSTSGDPTQLLQAAPVSSFYWAAADDSAASIEFTFPIAVNITGITFVQDRAADQHLWQVAGSNDGVNYTNLGSPIHWGPTAVSEGLFANTGNYRRYRISYVAGSGGKSNSPFQQAIYFKISQTALTPGLIANLADFSNTAPPAAGEAIVWDDTQQKFTVGSNPNSVASNNGGIYTAWAKDAPVTSMGANTQVDVPGLSLTFTLAHQSDIRFEIDALMIRPSGGVARFDLVDNGVIISPSDSTNGALWYSYNTTELNRHNVSGSYVATLAAGTHVIKLQYADALTASNTTWDMRNLTAQVVTNSLSQSVISRSSPCHVVQSKGFIGDAPALAMDMAFTAGNTIYVLGTHWTVAGNAAPGWTLIFEDGGSDDGMMLLSKVATSADGNTVVPFTGWGGGNNIAVFEVAGGSTATPSFAYVQQQASTSMDIGSAVDGSLLIGFFGSLSSNVAPSAFTGVDFVSTYTGTAPNASPRQVSLFSKVVNKGDVFASATYAAATEQYAWAVVIEPRTQVAVTNLAKNLGPYGSHKYWRLDMSNSYSNAFTTADISFYYDPTGVAIDRTGVIATADQTYGGFTLGPAGAFDNDYTTAWGTTDNVPHWICAQFPNAIAVTAFSWKGAIGNTQLPATIGLSYSDDGVNFTQAFVVNSIPWVSGDTRKFVSPLYNVAAQVGTIAEAPKDNTAYVRRNAGWVSATPTLFPVAAMYPTVAVPALTTWVIQGTSTLTTNTDGSVTFIGQQDTSDTLRGVFTALPATPYKYTFGFIPTLSGVNFQSIGFALRDSASGKMVVFSAYRDGTAPIWFIANYDSPTSKNGNVSVPTAPTNFNQPVYLTIADDGTNRTASFGFDPNYLPFNSYSFPTGTFITPDSIGLVSSNNSTSPSGMTVFSWKAG